MYYYKYGTKGFLKATESYGAEASKAGKIEHTDNVFIYIDEAGKLKTEKQSNLPGMLVHGGQLGSADENSGTFRVLAVNEDNTTQLLDYKFATKSSAMSCLKGLSLTYPTVYVVKINGEAEEATNEFTVW